MNYAAIPGFEGYYAAEDGAIWSTKSHGGRGAPGWRRLKTYPNPMTGYHWVRLRRYDPTKRYNRASISVHRLVLLAFGGPQPAGCEVRHLNRDKLDNRIGNLAWGTKTENAIGPKALANEFGVSRSVVKLILYGHSWGWLDNFGRHPLARRAAA